MIHADLQCDVSGRRYVKTMPNSVRLAPSTQTSPLPPSSGWLANAGLSGVHVTPMGRATKGNARREAAGSSGHQGQWAATFATMRRAVCTTVAAPLIPCVRHVGGGPTRSTSGMSA